MAVSGENVVDFYNRYLGRSPSAEEINIHATGGFRNNLAGLESSIANSPEAQAYRSRAVTSHAPEMPSFEFPGFELSAEERALLDAQTKLVNLQFADLKRQSDLNAKLFPQQKLLAEQQLAFALEMFPKQKALIEQMLADATPSETDLEIQRLSDERALAALRGEPLPLSPGQQAQLDTIYGNAQQQGEQDLRRFAEELAAARGMHLTDAPIGAEVLRQQRDLTTNLETAKAQAQLDFGQSQQVFGEGVRQFQAGLQQQALQNRLSLAAGASTVPGTNPVNAAPLISSVGGTMQTLAGNRQAAAQYGLGLAQLQQQNYQFQQGLIESAADRALRAQIAQYQYGGQQPYSGPSALVTGLTAAAPVIASGINAAATYYSTARLKHDFDPLDPEEFAAAAEARGLPLGDAYDAALQSLRETPITRYRYTWEGPETRPHIGPVLEMAPPELTDDGWHLRLQDYVGLQHAGLKALDRRLSRVEAGR